ncbi:hypothetical protein CYLTODRAFT_388100 [Cylindrobasidium torrendii FP15055 ss-10]|uniref:L-lactate dehydrogenase (cytochrome) n=1 Tax=Cylindrobasidium torrendii FP15055 ss-10 TaxID=1314674 RepID=A0A0D7BTA9_9AGAR|nr:hypothetical protein CYLTODRAFT_388100 [Cylindrobasidium torrendii FP15055 ss-10]
MTLSLVDVAKHSTNKSCWVIIQDKVYDVTDFLAEHPGGSKVILKYAGRDATQAYLPIHPPDALKTLDLSKHLGPLDSADAQQLHIAQQNRVKTKDELRVEEQYKKRPPLGRILSLADFESLAQLVLSHKAWAYYSSSADTTSANVENARAFSRFFFNPRVMRPVRDCSPATKILGFDSSLPLFVSGAALAKLGHPLGEANITRGAHKGGIIQMVSSNASLSFAEVAAAAEPGQTLFFQLYKHTDDSLAVKRVREIESLGYKAIFLTVDALTAGKRECDVRAPWVLEDMENGPAYHVEGGPADIADDGGTAGALVGADDQNMTWEKTIPWLRSITKLPLVIKGVQCLEDAVLAAEAGCDGILISNHGGRQLDYSMPPLETLYRIRKRRPDLFDKMEIYIDGGARRGTDVVKAICLGAKAVGMGRPFLYAQSCYGADGVAKAISILDSEIVKAMKFLGAAKIEDLVPEMVERVDWQAKL